MEMIFEKIKISLGLSLATLSAKCEIIPNGKLDEVLYFNISGISISTLKKILDIADHPTKAVLYKKSDDDCVGFQNFVDFLITSIKNLSELEIEVDENIQDNNFYNNGSKGIFDRYNKSPNTGIWPNGDSGTIYYDSTTAGVAIRLSNNA